LQYKKPNPIRFFFGIIRAFIRLILLILIILFFGLPLLILPKKNQHKSKKIRRFYQWSLNGLILAACNVKLNITGTKPPGKVCLVTNHIGLVEVMALAHVVGGHFIAKKSLASYPVLGPIFQRLGTFFIDRNSLNSMMNVSRSMEGALKRKEGILFFPEGTTSRGNGIREPFTALLNPMIKMKLPIYVALIRAKVPNKNWPPASFVVSWADGLSIGKHIWGMLMLPKIVMDIDFVKEPLLLTNRQSASNELWDVMVDNFEPMIQLDEASLAALETPLKDSVESFKLKQRPIRY
jgi:1-acyl-sn-glycerol-3-phosphate acyltransferase